MAARCDEEVAKSVFTKCIQKLGYLQLKPEQLKVIIRFVNGRDVFAVLPTGYGKTLSYACLFYAQISSVAGMVDSNLTTQAKYT